MAGFMTKLRAYVYDGEMTNGAAAAVENGTIMVRGTSTNYNKLVMPAADTASKFLYLGKEAEEGGTAVYRFRVIGLATDVTGDTPTGLQKEYFFVENGFADVHPAYTAHTADAKGLGYFDLYNLENYTVPVGGYVRAHKLEDGEEFVTTKITGTLTAGTAYGVKTDGTIG